MPTPARVAAVLDLVLGLGLLGETAIELASGGLAGLDAAWWISLGGLILVPSLVLVGLGVLAWRGARAAWPLHIAVGVALAPLGIGLVYLALMAPRSVRWGLGIGPDVVLAEIDAVEETTLEALAARHRVPPAAILGLIERSRAAGAFTGALDRDTGRVYSADTVTTREALRRCPRCGSAVDALGNFARCPACDTAFAEVRGLDAPMPMPVALEVVQALDRGLGFAWIFVSLVWIAIVAGYDRSALDPDTIARLLLVCVVAPVGLGLACFILARALPAGRRRALWVQLALLPPAAPWLLGRRVRVLYGAGVDAARRALADAGSLDFDRLAASLGLAPARGPELAVHLTATGRLEGLIDWPGRRVLTRVRAALDGREGCAHCGAPHRLGGWCAYCGTHREVPRADAGAHAPVARRSDLAWALGAGLLAWGYGLGVIAIGASTPTAADATPSAPPADREDHAHDGPLVPVRDYAPDVAESFEPVGIRSLDFIDDDTLVSGEGNGLFVWSTRPPERRLRTPKDWRFLGARWVPGPGPGLVVRPYHQGLVFGTRWSVDRVRDLSAWSRSLDATLRDVARVDEDRLRLAWSSRDGRSVLVGDEDRIEARLPVPDAGDQGPARLLLSPGGARLARWRATGHPQLAVWRLEDEALVLAWSPPDRGPIRAHVQGLAFAPDGRRIVVALSDRLLVVDPDEGSVVRTLLDPGAGFSGPLAWSADGRRVAAGTGALDDARQLVAGLRWYAVENGARLGRIELGPGTVGAVAWAPDGRRLAVGFGAGVVRLFELDEAGRATE